ncbi:MAG: hypothetical protein PVF83_16200 [Anaerolineales bacterium]|jgi:hypothetical protein
MLKKVYIVGIVIVFLLITVSPASATTYLISMDKVTAHYYWESDGTLSILYEFTITNLSPDPMDFLDVDMPYAAYSPSNAYADINGNPIPHIAHSEVESNAIELGLEEYSIPTGETAQIRFWIQNISNILSLDPSDDTYVGVNFNPSYFGSSTVQGTTDLTVVVHFPPGLTPEEPRYHAAPSGWQEEPFTGFDEDGRFAYTWQNENANSYTQYVFGVSFPAQYIPEESIIDPFTYEPPDTYTPTSSGFDADALIGFAIVCGVFLMIIGIPVLAAVSQKNRKLKYLPPKIAIEGHGIKRGLTAIEAAILLEEPMDKILTMILFAVIKKNAASVTKKDPLTLNVAEPLPDGLKTYEKEFLEAMEETGKAKRRRALQLMMITLVKSVSRSMKGFSRKETRDYYKKIIERAWAQVEAADTPEVRSEKYDEVMEWTMLDEEYDDRTRRVFQHYPVFVPTWWHRYDPTPTSTSSSPIRTSTRSASTPSSSGTSMPHLPGSDFAASVVNGIQGFSAGVIGSVSDFTSGITNKTNPIPKASSSGYRSGGGGSSCACACACAGCACACAGGGR